MSDSSNTDDNSNLVDMDDLEAFEQDFFGKTKPVEVEEVDETDVNPVATEEDEDANEEGETSEEDKSDEGEDAKADEAEAPKPEKTKSKTQLRIEQLVAEARTAERERDAAREELLKLKAAAEANTNKTEDKPLTEQLPAEAPKPDAVDDEGEPIYPLGEIDPKFIFDLSKFAVAQETKAAKEVAERERQAAEIAAQQAALNKSWAEKVEKVSEELPDYGEKITALSAAFQGIDQQYGEFLATTIMQCDNGPEIMYYLSQNIGEAQNIVASGPLAATLAIGKLQARLEKPVQEDKRNTKKVSDAPTPPPAPLRGKGGQFQVRPDTDDLDAFEKEFYGKK